MKILKIMLFVLLVYVARVSSLLASFQPAKYTQEPYERTRNRTISRSANSVPAIHETLTFIGLVEQYPGYTAEEYDVKTDDGYILKLHRVSGSPHSPQRFGKPVVYFQHGLLGSSDIHVVMEPDQALTFQLADAGYDVWLGNVRGTTYSKRHVRFSSVGSNPDFWNFSLDEMSTIDLPKFIDTVLEKTGQKKLTYIGLSMGTTLSYILLSEKPEYNDKMNVVISIAPVAFFNPPFRPLVDLLLLVFKQIKTFALTNRDYQLLPHSKLMQIGCTSDLGKIFCGTLLVLIGNPKNMDFTALPRIFAHVPAGTSLNTVDHYSQMVISGEPRKYSFGLLGNSARYGKLIPPKYDFSKITSRQALFYAGDDSFVSEVDTATVKKNLKNVVAYEKAPKGYDHLDFMFSVNLKQDINDRILEVIAENL